LVLPISSQFWHPTPRVEYYYGRGHPGTPPTGARHPGLATLVCAGPGRGGEVTASGTVCQRFHTASSDCRCSCVIRCRRDVCGPMAVTSGSVPSQATLPCHPSPGCYSTGAVDLSWSRALRYDVWLHPCSGPLCPHDSFSSRPLSQGSTTCVDNRPAGARNTMPTPTTTDGDQQ